MSYTGIFRQAAEGLRWICRSRKQPEQKAPYCRMPAVLPGGALSFLLSEGCNLPVKRFAMKEVRNVVIACDYAYVEGGAAGVAIRTAVLLSEMTGYRVYFFGGCGEAAQELKNSGVTCVLAGLPDLLQNPSKADAFIHGIYNRNVYRQASEFFRTLDPEETVLHVHSWTKVLTSAVFRAAKDCGVPVFLTIHDYFLTCPNGGCYNYVRREICGLKPMSLRCIACNCDSRSYLYKIWRCLRQQKQNRVLKRIDIRYIYISAFQREQLSIRGVRARKEFEVRNVIAFRERYRIRAEENELFLFAGRIAPEKGVELFCEAVTRAGVKAVAAGDGPLREKLEKKYPNILFPGWLTQKELQDWKEKTRCLVFPSVWYEGSPLTVPEMQAYGIPCIVTDCSAAVDTVTDGKNGRIVRAEIPELEQAVRDLSDDTQVKEMSSAAYDGFDAEGRSAETYVKRLTEVYGDRG